MRLTGLSKCSKFYKSNVRKRTSEQDKNTLRELRFQVQVARNEWALKENDNRFVKVGAYLYRAGATVNETTPHGNTFKKLKKKF